MLFSVNSASKGSDLERPNMEIPRTCFWSCGIVCLSLACHFFFSRHVLIALLLALERLNEAPLFSGSDQLYCLKKKAKRKATF